MSLMESLSRSLTYLLFMGIGYLLSNKLPRPPRPTAWATLVVCIVLSGYVGTNTTLISVFGAVIYLSALLQGLGIGLFAGFLVRKDDKPISR